MFLLKPYYIYYGRAQGPIARLTMGEREEKSSHPSLSLAALVSLDFFLLATLKCEGVEVGSRGLFFSVSRIAKTRYMLSALSRRKRECVCMIKRRCSRYLSPRGDASYARGQVARRFDPH